jgi:hypothetical protein
MMIGLVGHVITTRILWGKFLENGQLEDREGCGRIILSQILENYVLRMGDGWNWLRTVYNGTGFCGFYTVSYK